VLAQTRVRHRLALVRLGRHGWGLHGLAGECLIRNRGGFMRIPERLGRVREARSRR